MTQVILSSYDKHKLDQFLHYIKACFENPKNKVDSFVDIIDENMKGVKTWCPFTHGKRIDIRCYITNPGVQTLLAYLDKYLLCNRFLDANRYYLDDIDNAIRNLKNPLLVETYNNFSRLLSGVRYTVRRLDPNLKQRLSGLTCQECQRLDESIVAFSNYCFRASTIMAVSAVEFRLHHMIRNIDKEMYAREFEKSTLGQLIQVFDKDKWKDKRYDRIKDLMPRRHQPLVELLNEYRIFSAHPKDIEVSPQVAESILNLSFAFMTDKETCIYDPSLLTCDSTTPGTAKSQLIDKSGKDTKN